MKINLIRATVKNILLETRANLPIRAVMRTWWRVAARTSRYDVQLKSPPHPRNQRDYTARRVSDLDKHQVFDSLTDETKDWVLKHWKTREYFGNMIAGVALTVTRSYTSDYEKASGMKQGWTNISQGTWDSNSKTWIGGMTGFLSMKSDNRHGFLNTGLEDLAKQDSVLIHEFQHWFQESVMYADDRLKVATSGKNNSKGVAWKEEWGTSKPVSNFEMVLLKRIFATEPKCIDMSTSIMHPVSKVPMYRVVNEKLLHQTIEAYQVMAVKMPWDKMWLGDAYMNLFLAKDRQWAQDFFANTLKMHITKRGWDDIYYELENLDKRYPVSRLSGLMENWFEGTDYSIPEDLASTKGGTKGMHLDVFSDKMKLLRGSSVTIEYADLKAVEKKGAKKFKAKTKRKELTQTQLEKGVGFIGFSKNKKLTRGEGPTFSIKRRHKLLKTRGIKTPNRYPEWKDKWEEYEAESRNYLSGIILNLLESTSKWSSIFRKSMLASDEFEIASILYSKLFDKLSGRINPKLVRKNSKELEKMCQRVADRIVEVTENNPVSDFFEQKNKKYKMRQNTRVTEEEIGNWISGEVSGYPQGFGDYFMWLHDKIIGEIES